METNTNNPENEISPCAYKPVQTSENNGQASDKCVCPTPITCHCTALSNPWLRHVISTPSHPQGKIGLIAYIRERSVGPDAAEQLRQIEEYCAEHRYKVTKVFQDSEKLFYNLQSALEELSSADGLIACDLNRFVEHTNDRLRDIRPFVHHFFCHANKHLITIKEGIDTRAPLGQLTALELISQLNKVD